MSVVLIVEDDHDFREMLCTVMRAQDYTVCEAAGGTQALNLIENQHTDLVITDIIMPDMEGLALITELKQSYPELKIIAISGGGRSDPDDYLACAKAVGADAVFSKPVPISHLVEKTKVLLAAS